jgi:hypothetical protein
LSTQCEILNISQPYRRPWPVTGIALFFTISRVFNAASHLPVLINVRSVVPKLSGEDRQGETEGYFFLQLTQIRVKKTKGRATEVKKEYKKKKGKPQFVLPDQYTSRPIKAGIFLYAYRDVTVSHVEYSVPQ